MKNIIVKANADVLTNFEVLDLINSKRASKGTTRVIAAIARSEYKVCDYLNETVASTQTLESCTTFSNKCKDFKLTKVEILNIINVRPFVDFKALLDPVCDHCGAQRTGDRYRWNTRTQMEKDQDETNNGGES
ncbi:hypothetical protein IGI04_023880 [Brassica rapa subsp. trilocularis]|uniref:DNA-directed RNA polymerase III subunit RPC9 n=1 Tax=Brassica rapa subsp. trilocularis TaxID=1813537 RepID=A0ABQ7M556_BRACM|nr:hypothetical protein IGI04_023880 [Brassica rapa subsp. trilocularis]